MRKREEDPLSLLSKVAHEHGWIVEARWRTQIAGGRGEIHVVLPSEGSPRLTEPIRDADMQGAARRLLDRFTNEQLLADLGASARRLRSLREQADVERQNLVAIGDRCVALGLVQRRASIDGAA